VFLLRGASGESDGVVYVFDEYSLDTDRRELRRKGSLVPVQPQVFDVLQYLISQRHRVVSKDDLIEAVWRGRIVSESTLSSRITGVRQAIQDSGETQRLIRTIPRRGVRFVGEVYEQQSPFAEVPVISAELPEAQTQPRSAERRQVTVFACDFLGSVAPSAHLDPEDMADIVDVCFQQVREVVERHGGFMADNTTDQVLALFGFPQSSEDDAERAVRTGLALVQAVSKPQPEGFTNPLQPRIGISTGLVIFEETPGAASKHKLVGEPVRAALRLIAIANQEGVLIEQNTHRLVGDLFECGELDEAELEKFGFGIRVRRVIRESPIANRFDALHPSRSQLIGRGEEIDLLLRRWNQARSGDGRVVLVTGEPGIGKSRLVKTLLEKFKLDPLALLLYDCSPHHRDTALFPIKHQLLQSAGIESHDGANEKLDKLETMLVQSHRDLSECMPLFVALLSIGDATHWPLPKLTPQRQRERTLEALLGHVRGLAARQPVIMVFEDLQWIDPTSLELVCRIVDQAQQLPILVLATFRPEFTPPWPNHSHVSTIALSHLGQSESRALVREVASDKVLAPELVTQIIARADGIPLFLEELTKEIMERDRLGDAGEQCDVGPLPHLSIPSTLQASLVARLDRLGSAKQLAQIAAVIGRDFSYRLLAAVSRVSEPELHAALTRLTDSELIFRRGVPPGASYVFKHALVQDAAYGTLLRSRRQQLLHAHVAKSIEEFFPEIVTSQPALLAQHCTEAGLSQKAITYWLLAGQQAWAQTAATEAVAQLRKGLAILRDLPDDRKRRQLELDLQIALRPALAAIKGSASAEVGETIARARTLAEQVDRSDCLVPLMLGQWAFHLVRSEHSLALSIAKQIEQTGVAQNDVAAKLQGHRAAGWTRCYLGHLIAARKLLEKSGRLGDPVHRAFTAGLAEAPYPAMLGYRAVTLAHLGYIDQAKSQLTEALAESRRLQHAYTQALVLLCANWTAAITGFAERKQHAEELRAISADDLPTFFGYGTAFLGSSLTAVGKADEGVVLLTQGLSMVRATGTVLNTPRLLMALGETHASLGRHGEALNCLRGAQRIIEITGERVNEAELRRLYGDLISRMGDPIEAEQMYHHAMAIARSQSAKLFELRAATSLARLWSEQGKKSVARELLERPYGWFSEGFDTLILRDALTLLQQL